ncbi:MAG: GNAT family N-acetyltransferase [Roseivirga sp.]
MGMSFIIRLVEEKDIPQILDIYTPFVLTTTVSFETEAPSPEVFSKRVKAYASLAPWLVAVDGDTVLGYAYATAHRSRGAYRWNQETTVYVHPDHRRKGIARALYAKLLKLLKAAGYTKALAVITLPNDASIRFHERLGFEHIGEMQHIGFKFDRWHTTSWWDKNLQEAGFIPGLIKPVTPDLLSELD